jgi:hypothetical protein
MTRLPLQTVASVLRIVCLSRRHDCAICRRARLWSFFSAAPPSHKNSPHTVQYTDFSLLLFKDLDGFDRLAAGSSSLPISWLIKTKTGQFVCENQRKSR